jgi:chaperonin GroEL
MRKLILTGKEANEKIYEGVKKVSDAVVSTLGPMGRCAIISRCFPSQNGMQYYMPFSTKDGVTVARNITLDDQIENTGANFVKQASEKTMLDAGDGTTTTVLLAKVILEKGLELVNAGANPHELKKGIDAAVSHVVAELKKMAVPIDGDIEKIRQVATVSANNDNAIGDLIAEAFSKIGSDGVIDIEESKSEKTEIVISEGIKIKRGWESQYFITNKAKNECELTDPYILLYDKKISTIAQFGEALAPLISDGKQLLIVCPEADGEALAALAMNASNGSFKSCIIKCPEFGDKQREVMEDLAAITGATYISDEKGRALKTVTVNDLGKAKKVVVSKNETSIISPSGNKKEIKNLLDNLKMDLTKASIEEQEQINNRIARLTGSVAVLYVGAATEVEMKEKKDRCDDAVRATKAAISEGYIAGSGMGFINATLVLDLNSPLYEGMKLIAGIKDAPLKQICSNAGVDYNVIRDKIQDRRTENISIGYNAKTDTVENLIEAGIIDPVKVLRCSLENAASVAAMILTSNTLIVDTI